MNISNALSNAASGLSASARLADTISNNVSNAMTPGFGRRTTELSSLALGGYGSGVRVAGTARTENTFLTAERRSVDAAAGSAGVVSEAWDRILSVMGEPGSPNSLATRATALETALLSAVTSPQSMAKLGDAVVAAKELVGTVNRISDENTRLRTEADAEIARQVNGLNDALNAIDEINNKIAILRQQGADITGLQDERSRIVDSVSSIVPVKAIKRDGDQIALYAQNGGVLLDGRVYELRFNPATNVVTHDLTLANGALSALAQDQGAASGPVLIETGSPPGLLDGGTLGALFEVRDTLVPQFNAEIDLYAADLIERFRDLMPPAALDASGDGLFVGSDPAQPGLAGRLEINAAVDPAQTGGAVWRLRDGLSATAPGVAGFGAYLQALSDSMSALRDPVGFVSQSARNGSATMASEIGSFFAGNAVRSDENRSYLVARGDALSQEESNAIGVNTDKELQSLILVEQAYAANARVLSVVDDLMKLLLEV